MWACFSPFMFTNLHPSLHSGTDGWALSPKETLGQVSKTNKQNKLQRWNDPPTYSNLHKMTEDAVARYRRKWWLWWFSRSQTGPHGLLHRKFPQAPTGSKWFPILGFEWLLHLDRLTDHRLLELAIDPFRWFWGWLRKGNTDSANLRRLVAGEARPRQSSEHASGLHSQARPNNSSSFAERRNKREPICI